MSWDCVYSTPIFEQENAWGTQILEISSVALYEHSISAPVMTACSSCSHRSHGNGEEKDTSIRAMLT